MLHPLLYVSLITKKHFLTFNHSVLSHGSNSGGHSFISTQQAGGGTSTVSSDIMSIYPYIHVLNCNTSTTVEDLFLFFVSPVTATSSSSVSPPSQQRLPMLLTTSPKTPNIEFNDPTTNLQSPPSSSSSQHISMHNNPSTVSTNNSLLSAKHKRSTSLSIHQDQQLNSTVTSTTTTNNTPNTTSNHTITTTNASPPSSFFKASSPPTISTTTLQTTVNMEMKRQSLKGTHNKNIFSFDDRYFMTHLAEQINVANNVGTMGNTSHPNNGTTNSNQQSNSTTSSSLTNSSTVNHQSFHHQHVPSMPSSSPFTSPPSPLQRHGSVLISKRNYKHHSKHQSNQNTSLFSNNFDLMFSPNTMLDLGVKIEKMEMENSKNVRILILNNFRSVSKRVKYALLEIFKFKKVILGDKTFDIPFEFICICDTLELPNALLCEFIGFVPSLSISSTFTLQDVQNYSSNIQHIMSQHSKNMDRKSTSYGSLVAPSLIDCVDVTVKIQQYVRDIIAVCRHHPLVKQYPTPEVTSMIIMAAKAYALMWNKTFVTPTHVQAIISNVLYPRVECNSEDKWSILQDVVSCVLPP
ncbi:hypothetical protein C9374_011316 [Naegleria lovaniensis]|uniref:Uncharacterized protein n=1 Tax=Naegleria lovaniensis TaxID=51637 RepID=A0AA88H494_NAELO|nr:uncharacterized protein C9374_011316 [Naegleria lovaniensis]KAG2392591.1 hypothetical protein C9374_011316 [Naegleria lovaniensis]